MPVPRAVARFQRRFVNPVVGRLAGVLPGYGLLLHVGRKSGRTYRTPLNVFKAPGGFAIVIAYGHESDWLRNVRASRGAEVVKRGKRYTLSNPRIVSGPRARGDLPLYGRLISRGTRSPDILLLDATPA
jgi:deazaflavin-dependent oxidoreductase (nitroreductase family)